MLRALDEESGSKVPRAHSVRHSFEISGSHGRQVWRWSDSAFAQSVVIGRHPEQYQVPLVYVRLNMKAIGGLYRVTAAATARSDKQRRLSPVWGMLESLANDADIMCSSGTVIFSFLCGTRFACSKAHVVFDSLGMSISTRPEQFSYKSSVCRAQYATEFCRRRRFSLAAESFVNAPVEHLVKLRASSTCSNR